MEELSRKKLQEIVERYNLPRDALFLLDSIAFQLMNNYNKSKLVVETSLKNFAKTASQCGPYASDVLRKIDESYSKAEQVGLQFSTPQFSGIRYSNPNLTLEGRFNEVCCEIESVILREKLHASCYTTGGGRKVSGIRESEKNYEGHETDPMWDNIIRGIEDS